MRRTESTRYDDMLDAADDAPAPDGSRNGSPNGSLSLFADLYELTMAQAYWKAGVVADARFSLFTRRMPPDRGYLVFAGLDDMLAALEDMRFVADDIAYLRSLSLFDEGFLRFLSRLRFTGSACAMPEGSVFFAGEPVFEAHAPIIEAQLAETLLLNRFNIHSTLASKAARVVSAAGGAALADFAARRTQGVDAAMQFARASYMVGFFGTSNALAAKKYGIPPFGTMAHSFIAAVAAARGGSLSDGEAAAFSAYADAFPDDSAFLVDTFDTQRGIARAISVALKMRERGHSLRAVRLDSGDLLSLSRLARKMLDSAGLSGVQVFASGGLDEFEIERLLGQGAPIDGFGIGTMAGVSADYPFLDCVYKLTEYDGKPALKLSPDKRTTPGAKQVFRRVDASGQHSGDIIAAADEPAPRGAEPMLQPVMRGGRRVGAQPTLPELRRRFSENFARLPAPHKRLRGPQPYPVETSARLRELERRALQSI